MNTNVPVTEMIEIESPWDFDQTVERISQAIKDAGLFVIARLDHAAGAKAHGLEMPPTLVIVYGHPKGGTPLMRAVPAAALDLPLRVLVREASPHQVTAAFHPIVELLGRLGVPAELARPLERAQQLIRDTLGA